VQPVRILVPFKLDGAKSRLSPILSPEERAFLAISMLKDVLDAVSSACVGGATILFKPGNTSLRRQGIRADVRESGLELNEAINSFLEEWADMGWPSDVLIAMSDLALLCPEEIRGVLGMEGDVVLSPGKGGGTNLILIRDPRFRTCYQGLSFPKHIDFCRRAGLSAGIYASYFTGCDIDVPEDLAEVLIHGWGRSKEVLIKMGFALSESGRAGCIRITNQAGKTSDQGAHPLVRPLPSSNK
jgi:2-phospho-L-lactate guanylyltransferase